MLIGMTGKTIAYNIYLSNNFKVMHSWLMHVCNSFLDHPVRTEVFHHAINLIVKVTFVLI